MIRKTLWAAALCLAWPCMAAAAGIQAHVEYDSVTVQFDAAMATWRNAALAIRTEPVLPLACRWDDDTHLACAIKRGHARRATAYRVHLPALQTQAGETLPPVVLDAETERPRLEFSAWSLEWDDGWPRIVLDPNQAMTRAAVLPVLDVRVDHQPAAFALAETTHWNRRAFVLTLRRDVPQDSTFELSVRPGLRGTEGTLPGQQDERLLQTRINPAPRLLKVSCARDDHDWPLPNPVQCPTGTIRLSFSRPLDDASKQRFAEQLPEGMRLDPGSWSVERSYGDGSVAPPRQRVVLHVDPPRQHFAVPMAGLRTVGGAAFPADTLRIDSGDIPPAARAPHAAMLLADPAATPVTVVNADGKDRLVADVLARERSRSERPLPVGARNGILPIADRLTTKALRQGGWARWTFERDGKRGAISLAAPAFDVTTISTEDDVLVWANEWTDQAPVAAAQVELLLQRADAAPVVMARGTTAGDGVAVLRMPAGFVLDEGARRNGTWFVRVRADGPRGERLAVSPLGGSGDWNGLRLGWEEGGRSWGVTDRPIYRPGDRVRFRLWWRGVHAGRLAHAAPPPGTRLRLYDVDQDRTLSSWSQPPRDDGWRGEASIPAHAPDGIYCVVTEEEVDPYHGACFQVGVYRAQDLWVEAAMPDRIVHVGDRLAVDLHGGYYSGGPAAGVEVRRIGTMLTGWPLQDAYPRYAGYTFADMLGAQARDGIALDIQKRTLRTDANGQVRLDLPVRFQPPTEGALELPLFGRLQVTAELGLSAREGTTSNAVSARFARAGRFVGLRLSPRWLDAASPVRADAVVIDANGGALEGQPVNVRVEYRAGWDDRDAAATATVVGTCELRSGAPGDCTFPRARSGRYRLVARSGDAAPASIEQYVWAGDRDAAQSPDPELVVDGAVPPTGQLLPLVLRRAPVGWPVLFVASQHGRVIGHLRTTSAGAAGYALPLADVRPGPVDVTGYLRDPRGGGIEGSFRQPVAIRKASTTFNVPLPPQAAITLQAQPAKAAPGQRVLLVVRNTTGGARRVAISVMDDALRALAAGNSDFWDPRGPSWLGDTGEDWERAPVLRSFASWNDAPWSLSLGPSDKEAREGGFASAAAAAPSQMAAGDSARSLDRVAVTGSRIPLADVFRSGGGRQDVHAPHAGQGASGLFSRLARVRGDFADVALWLDDLTLQAGESRTLELTLPDNLTRWRAVAWSSDAEDDFQVAELTLEAGLPVEARLQAPVRLYPGDRARLQGNVRQQGDAAAQAQVALRADGAGVAADTAGTRRLPAGGQAAFALSIRPSGVGTIDVVAAAGTSAGSDGVGSRVAVADPMLAARKVQVGWLDARGVLLEVPSLPPGAQAPRLDVQIRRGPSGLLDHWTGALRDYPHRCWEQILSRAIGAALALARHDDAWPAEDARATVAEAIDNAAAFQDEHGSFHYFAYRFQAGQNDPQARYALTAYSVRGLELLGRLGYAVDSGVLQNARALLANRGMAGLDDKDPDEIAFASAIVPARAPSRDRLWRDFDRLSLPARIAFAQGLAQSGDAHATQAIDRLLELAPLRGEHRAFAGLHEWPRWIATPLSAQCNLIALLDGRADRRGQRRQLIAGLTDLYAGGHDTTDTQAAASCLMALQGLSSDDTQAIVAEVDAGARHDRVAVAPAQDHVEWQASATGIGSLHLATIAAGDVPASYSAELSYQEDARRAQPSSVGFALERRYDVLRGGRWMALAKASPHEGDWVRVTLVLSSSTTRYFVAVSDEVPGGLQPTDLGLAGVAGVDLKQVSDTGSWWFDTRRLDPRTPRFYAEYLPAGRHVLHYFARVGNAGDYLAAPATAELMYGTASRARTAAQRIVIGPDRESK